MGRFHTRRISELADGEILAPERYDPRRAVAGEAVVTLGELVQVVSSTVTPTSLLAPFLLLETGHAVEGRIEARHAPQGPDGVGSAKRILQAGDVVISRLRPYLRQVAYIDPGLFERLPGGNGVVCSAELLALRARPGSDFAPAALVPFLLSAPVQAALAAAQEGGHHPRVSREALAALPVPQTVVLAAPRLAAGVRAMVALAHATTAAAAALIAEIEAVLD